MKYLLTLLLPCILLTGFVPNETGNLKKNPGSSVIKATVEDAFNFMRCHRQGKKIAVTWGMNSEAGITNFLIYHSEDGEFFNLVGEVSPTGSRRNSFMHDYLYPGYHHYKVVAVMSVPPNAVSDVDIVRIVH